MEFVYVVERRHLFDLSFPHGLVSAAQDRPRVRRYLERIRDHGFFLERRKAELDSSFKQIIPYVLIQRSGTLLLLQRKSGQGESRLHGKLSIGIGGHINPVDGQGAQVLDQGLRRELEEELALSAIPVVRVAGFLNDDASDVGAVHFGLVAVADATGIEVAIRETEMMEGRFVPRDELTRLHQEERARFETWSALLLDRLDEVLAADLPIEQALGARG